MSQKAVLFHSFTCRVSTSTLLKKLMMSCSPGGENTESGGLQLHDAVVGIT